MTTTTSQDTLKALLDEITNADPEMLPPPGKKEAGDKHLGFVTDEYIKKVFSLNHFYRREAQRLQIDIEATGEDPKLSPEYNQYKQRMETLLEMFWFLLRSHGNFWGNDIGIRKGWEVVQCGNNDDQLPKALLKKLLGGE
jgi:hypothetical protein